MTQLDALWGHVQPTPRRVEIGDWAFTLRADEVADLSFAGATVLRSIRAVVRDGDWNTVPTVVTDVVETGAGLVVHLDQSGLGASVASTLTISAGADGFSVALRAENGVDFSSCRLGLVVLHPPADAGSPLAITSDDGRVVHTAYPTTISPWQPAYDIRTLEWTTDGLATRVDFAGDVFEMEDQRNWTDASYKTYSTPLALPFPVVVAAGAVVEQSVTVRSTRVAPAAPASTDTVPLVSSGFTAPDVTLGASTVPTSAFAGSALPQGVAAVLIELDARTDSWPAALDRAALEAGDLPLDVRITAVSPDDVRVIVEALAGHTIVRLGVFAGKTHVSEPELWEALVAAAPEGVELVGGARSHFTELNRQHHRLPTGIPAVTFAITPQMHAIEREQIVESIPMQSLVARDAAAIAGDRPLHVGPITLRSRFNAVANSSSDDRGPSSLESGYGAELLPSATDERQSSAAIAPWLVASYAAIASGADVASINYFETLGPRGLADASGEFPVRAAVAAVALLAGREVFVPRHPLPADVTAIGLADAAGGVSLLAANLTTDPIDLTFELEHSVLHLSLAPYEWIAPTS